MSGPTPDDRALTFSFDALTAIDALEPLEQRTVLELLPVLRHARAALDATVRALGEEEPRSPAQVT